MTAGRSRPRFDGPRVTGVLVAMFLTIAWAGAALADERDPEIRRLGSEGRALFDAGKYEEAASKFREAYALAPEYPTAGRWLGESLEKSGRLVEAREVYLAVAGTPSVANEPEVFESERRTARSASERLNAALGQLVLNVIGVRPETVELLVNGRRRELVVGTPLAVEAGTATVEASAEGRRTRLTPSIEPGQTLTLALDLSAPPPPPPAPKPDTPRQSEADGTLRTLGYVAAGAGIVSLGVGTFFGLRAKSKNDESNADGRCSADGCGIEGEELRNDAQSAATLSSAFFVAGGVLAAGGITLYLVGGPRTEPARSSGIPRLRLTPAFASGDLGIVLSGRL